MEAGPMDRVTRVSVSKRGEVQLHVLAGRTWTGIPVEGEEVDRLIDELTSARLRQMSGRSSR